MPVLIPLYKRKDKVNIGKSRILSVASPSESFFRANVSLPLLVRQDWL